MNLKMLMSIKSVICWVFGLASVLIPVQVLSLYGIEMLEGGIAMTRLFGASLIVLALWLGLDRDTQEDVSRRAVAIAATVGDLVGFALMVFWLFTGTVNALGWVNAAIYLILAVGFAYTLVVEPEGRFAA